MAGICFFFETYDKDVWSGRNIDLDAWIYAAKIAGDIDKMHVINRTPSKIQSPDRRTQFSISETMPELEGKVTYVTTPWQNPDAVPIWDFDHQTDWYAFGPGSGWHDKHEHAITIPQANEGIACHSVHIVTTVIMHRYKVLNG